jgi:aminoglycoside phosphotransferase (APT) family kinase protein
MLIRMPSGADYAAAVEKEQTWLPKLEPLLPLPIPAPIAMGKPDKDYPWKWSINRWLPGEAALTAPIADLTEFATNLAQFLKALQGIDATEGPLAGPHSFHRGGDLAVYDAETRQALEILKNTVDTTLATEVWESALATKWQNAPVWAHGDVSVGNLLVDDGKLSAVIDFGQLAVGDPACDLALAWTLFQGESRKVFLHTLQLDEATVARGRAWTLWKALILVAGIAESNLADAETWLNIIDEVMRDHRKIA